MADSSYSLGEAADRKTVDLSAMPLSEAAEDAPVMLDLSLEEDIAANLDHYILLSRQGFFENANDFFDVCLRKHASWFAILWEYCNVQNIQDRCFDPTSDGFLQWASRSYKYDLEETVLLDLLLGGTTNSDDNLERLRYSLRRDQMRGIDVCRASLSITL